jgi:hypothetical protein
MSGKINPEAAEPTTFQSFNQSDRNPAVENWGGTEAEEGLIPSPASSEARVTPEGPVVPPNAGLKY